MYITLAEAFMAQANFDDAVEILGKAAMVEEGFNGHGGRGESKDSSKNIKILALKAQCLCKQKHFEDAILVIDEVVNYTKAKRAGRVEYAFALVDRANILSEMNSPERLQKAI